MPYCKSCDSEKDANEFHFRDKAGGLRKTECKSCRKLASVGYRARPEVKLKSAQRHQERAAKSDAIHRQAAKDYSSAWHAKNKTRRNAEAIERYVEMTHSEPETLMIYRIRQRAKKAGLPFSLTVSDLVIPDVCPVLGLTLDSDHKGRRGPKQNSPSVDKIVPSLGYVSGNVRVMSHRANTLLNNATLEEMEKVVEFLRANPRPQAFSPC